MKPITWHSMILLIDCSVAQTGGHETPRFWRFPAVGPGEIYLKERPVTFDAFPGRKLNGLPLVALGNYLSVPGHLVLPMFAPGYSVAVNDLKLVRARRDTHVKGLI